MKNRLPSATLPDGTAVPGLRRVRTGAALLMLLAAVWLVWLLSVPKPVRSASGSVVISQIYTGGGSFRNGKYKNTFIELFNPGTSAVSLNGWSVQYAAANGDTWLKTELAGTIAPGHYYLVQEGAVFGGVIELPTPEARGNFHFDTSAGRVALVSSRALIASGTACPVGGDIVDLVGYGETVNCFEGSGPVIVTASKEAQAISRISEGCEDTDDNADDFVLTSPFPRNSASFHSCQEADLETIITAPAEVQAGERFTYGITVTNYGPAEALNVVVTDTLIPRLPEPDIGEGGALSDDTVTWPVIPLLAAGQSLTLNVTVQAPATGQTLINSAAAVTDSTDPDDANDSATVLTTVQAATKSEANTIRVSVFPDEDCSGPGATFQVEVRMTNTGLAPKPDNEGPELRVELPAELSLGGCDADSGNCRASRQAASWNGALEVGQTVTINLSVEVSPEVEPGEFCFNLQSYFDADGDGVNESSVNVETCLHATCISDEFPGEPPLPEWPLSAQKAGSVLIFPVLSSSAVNPALENTRINLTNTSDDEAATLHLFFVDGSNCSVADTFVCLTPNQTMSFTASDIDPGVTGFLIAVAVDRRSGCPLEFNHLIGDAYVRFDSGHAANLGAEAVAALTDAPLTCFPLVIPATATLNFDGISYNQLPRSLAVSSLASPEDGNSTLLILDRIGGSLVSQADSLGTIFGLLFDEMENPLSFSFSGGCQFRQVLSSQFPRTTPRLNRVIPSGRNGWMKLWPVAEAAMIGAVINTNPQLRTDQHAYAQGRNLHHLTLASRARLTIPVFSPTGS